ncbi:ABC-type uncharacterized transport system, permease component [Scardovia inopinata]|uniref:ABC-2 type transporter transmembrane domain-containing protein n=1 Tax=Scardovia inopinata F0304 TaxID=641146 RepID=W5IJL4_SCAIO|nr:ABC transporter permease [Scardovia inopinata]EFG27198.1 hypothetical protein HMPREF9020_00837 [Scardovia inopinata F0304]BAR06809.1 putative ABC transporter permease component [Scardovia inopinata JCM 12537]SUV50870.1 ABC-type uncharacterized transport system, permease component [Scardovia inopinata]
MYTYFSLTKRNITLFFKDKGMFYSSLITPAILLVLYVTFLGKVYRSNYSSAIPRGITIPSAVLDTLVSSQLSSSLLAVSCITVAFASNMLMVQDKANKTITDLTVSPVKRTTLGIAYLSATFLSTLIVNLTGMVMCLCYMVWTGWEFSFHNLALITGDVILLTFFGTVLSSIINFPLSTHGQISAVSSIVSAGYGFICGAYMPMSLFPSGLRTVLTYLPNTYGTALLRTHIMGDALQQAGEQKIPGAVLDQIKKSTDYTILFRGHAVSVPAMVLIMMAAVVICLLIFVIQNLTVREKS